VTGGQPAEPTLAEVQAQYPHLQYTRVIGGMYHAERQATGQRVTGEYPLDLRDQRPGGPRSNAVRPWLAQPRVRRGAVAGLAGRAAVMMRGWQRLLAI